jgi:hypothetical protein
LSGISDNFQYIVVQDVVFHIILWSYKCGLPISCERIIKPLSDRYFQDIGRATAKPLRSPYNPLRYNVLKLALFFRQ